MGTIKQSFSWDGFARMGIAPEALARGAAEIGYPGVELVPPEYFQLVEDSGLKIVTHTAHKLAPEGLNNRENRAALEKEISASLELAVKWKIPKLLCFSGFRYGIDDDTGAEITAENLRYFAALAEQADVMLIMETLNTNPNRDYMADNTAWGVKVCQLVDSPRVKLLYDIFHMQIMEGHIIHRIRTNHAYFGHYHTAGNPGRGDLDETQELYYPAIVRAIAETGYDGYLGHEFFPKGDPLAALKAAFDLCNGAV